MKKKSLIAKIGTFILVLAASGFGAYLLIPAKTITVGPGPKVDPIDVDTDETYFSRFVAKLTEAADENSETEISGLVANIPSLEITWPSQMQNVMNDIVVSGDINFKMRNLNDLEFTVDLLANYNGKSLDLAVGFVDNTFYFATKDLRIKSSYNNTQSAIEKINNLFFNPDNPNGLGISLDIGQLLNTLLETLDLGSLIGGSGPGLEVVETEIGDDVKIELKVDLDGTSLAIIIVIDKEELSLKGLDLGTIQVGDVTIKGKIDCVTVPDLKLIKLDDPNYPIQRGEFIEVINYVGWADRILNLLQTKSIGLELNAILRQKEDNAVIADLGAKLDLDATNLLDLYGIEIGADTEEMLNSLSLTEADTEESNEGILSDLLNNLTLNADITVGDGLSEKANLGLAYFDGNGYLALNESEDSAVMRTTFDTLTINKIVSKIPELIAAIGNDDKEAEEDAEGLFDFVTSSELVTAISEGHYEGILDVLKEVKNTATTIELVLDLSTLGFGENAEVALILNANEDAITNGTKVIDIQLKKVEIGSLILDGFVATKGYSDAKIRKIDANKLKYDKLDFVVGIFDQVTTILNSKKTGFEVSGSVLDDARLGFKFNGWGQLDYGAKYGYGSISFDEYKVNPDKMSAKPHKVDIDVDNSGDNEAFQNMLFTYRDTLKGKFTVKTLNDIIGLIKELIQKNDPRFTKFIDLFKEYLSYGIIGSILNGDYLELASASFIKSIAQNNEETHLDVVINKDSLPLIESDLVLRINFKIEQGKEKCLDSIEIVDLKVGEQNINLKISLKDFDEKKTSPINKNDKFMNFSDLGVLLEFGIDTTQLNYYHLTAKAKISALAFINMTVTLDFHIFVDGVTTKVYGKITDIPMIIGVSQDFTLFGSCDVSSEFVFEPNHDASGNDIGGYFHILRTEKHKSITNTKLEQYYFKSTSQGFLDNILDYLLIDTLDLNKKTVDDIMEASNKEKEPGDSDYEDLFAKDPNDTDPRESFEYTHTDEKDSWFIRLNLAALLGTSALGQVTVELNGKRVGENGYFTDAVVKMTAIKIIKITVNLVLENPNPEVKNWPDSIETNYQNVIGIYYNLDQNSKDSFDLNYLNHPLVEYKVR